MGPPELHWQFRLAPEQFYLLSLVLGCGICSFLLRHPAARLASPDEANEMLSQDLLVNAPLQQLFVFLLVDAKSAQGAALRQQGFHDVNKRRAFLQDNSWIKKRPEEEK